MTYPDHLSMHCSQRFYYENQRHLLQALALVLVRILALVLVLVWYQRFPRLLDRNSRYCCCCCCCCRSYSRKLHRCWIDNGDGDDETKRRMMSWSFHGGRCDGDDDVCVVVLGWLDVPHHYHCHLTALCVSPVLVLVLVPGLVPVPVPDYAFDLCHLAVVVKIAVVNLVVVMMTMVLSLLLSLPQPTTTSSLLQSHYSTPSYCEYSPYPHEHLFVTPSHQSHLPLNLPLHSLVCNLLGVIQQYQRSCYHH